MNNLVIRNETEGDCRAVEALTRDAFWNVNVPGCDEHYLAHVLRSHADFLPELDLVAELDGRVVGNVMYTRASLTDEAGEVLPVLTFGPLSVMPDCQRQGIGKTLLEHSFRRALELGHSVIVIFGNPDNYVSRGFRSARRYNVCAENGAFPAAMLVKELRPGVLDGRKWAYRESSAYHIDPARAEEFDKRFPPKKKAFQPSQEMFYILSRASVR